MATDLRRFYSRSAAELVTAAAPAPPVTINFDMVVPAPETYPIDFLKDAAPRALADPAGALGYRALDGNRRELALGNQPLRGQIGAWLADEQGMAPIDVDNVILTSGGGHAVALTTEAFLDPGDGVLVERLTWGAMERFLGQRGAVVKHVDIDADGLLVESLERGLEELRAEGIRPKLLYTIPTFHLPTLAVLPEQRRRRVLELAEEWDLVVVEDAEYAGLGYGRTPLPPSLLSLDSSGRVVQSHSFSKLIAPGLRIGWMTGAAPMIDALAAVRQDLGVSQWLARVVTEFLESGEFVRHLERARAVHLAKHDHAVESLLRHSGGIEAEPSEGGFHLWARLPAEVEGRAFADEAARDGITIRSYDAFKGFPPPHHVRLGFGHLPAEELDRGVGLLAAALPAVARG